MIKEQDNIEKMTDAKIINDPVFGFIKVPRGLLLDIVRHPLMQRLTRIKTIRADTGGVSRCTAYTFPTFFRCFLSYE